MILTKELEESKRTLHEFLSRMFDIGDCIAVFPQNSCCDARELIVFFFKITRTVVVMISSVAYKRKPKKIKFYYA